MAISGTLQCSLSMSEKVTGTAFSDAVNRQLNLGVSGIALQDIGVGAALGIKYMWSYQNAAFTGNTTFDLTALAVPNAAGYGTGSPIITLALVKAVYVAWGGTDGQVLYFGGGASNPWYGWTDTSTARAIVMGSSPLLLSNLLAQATNPWTVSGTAKTIELNAGSNTAPVTLAILGAIRPPLRSLPLPSAHPRPFPPEAPLMAAIAPTYLTGKGGSAKIDTVAAPITQWDGTYQTGTFDATNATTGGFAWPEATITSMNGTFTMLWTVTAGEPSFAPGEVHALVLATQTGSTYTFNALLSTQAISVDIKGGVTVTVSYMSQGTITKASA